MSDSNQIDQLDKTIIAQGEQLDRIYHAIPEWVNQVFPQHTLAERIKGGFEHTQKLWTETFQREVQENAKLREFLVFLTRTHGLDFGEEYWKFLVDSGLKKSEENKETVLTYP